MMNKNHNNERGLRHFKVPTGGADAGKRMYVFRKTENVCINGNHQLQYNFICIARLKTTGVDQSALQGQEDKQ